MRNNEPAEISVMKAYKWRISKTIHRRNLQITNAVLFMSLISFFSALALNPFKSISSSLIQRFCKATLIKLILLRKRINRLKRIRKTSKVYVESNKEYERVHLLVMFLLIWKCSNVKIIGDRAPTHSIGFLCWKLLLWREIKSFFWDQRVDDISTTQLNMKNQLVIVAAVSGSETQAFNSKYFEAFAKLFRFSTKQWKCETLEVIFVH